MSIAGEVTRRYRVWVRTHRVDDLGLESPVAVAQQHRHGTGAGDWIAIGVERAPVCDGQIEAAIVREVTRHDRQ